MTLLSTVPSNPELPSGSRPSPRTVGESGGGLWPASTAAHIVGATQRGRSRYEAVESIAPGGHLTVPRKCSICTHNDRDAMDAALVRGEANRRIASRFGVCEAAIRRHKAEHIPDTLHKAEEAGDVARADNLLSQLRALQDRAQGILGKAEHSGDLRTALLAIREARGCLELLAKLVGELQSGTDLHVVVAPEWVSLRGQVLDSLKEFPEARQAVVKALLEASGES